MASCMIAKMSGGLDFQVNNVARETAHLASQYVSLCYNRQFCTYAFSCITQQSWKSVLKNFIVAKSYRKDGLFTLHTEHCIYLSGIFPETYRVADICGMGGREGERKHKQHELLVTHRP